MTNSREARQKTFWRETMEAGYRFMTEILRYPTVECGESLACLRAALRGTGLEVAFSRRRLMSAGPPLFLLRAGLVPSFLAAAGALNRRGLVLRVEDAYRTRAMQDPLRRRGAVLGRIMAMAAWENGGILPPPEIIFRRLTVLVTTVPKLGTHMSGSALDISVLRRAGRRPLDLGGPYLEMSPATPMASPFIGAAARRNRALVNGIMRECGFRAYPFEFWHYSAGDAYDEFLSGSGRPARYGPVDADPGGGPVRPVADPCAPIVTVEAVAAAAARFAPTGAFLRRRR